jgi:hypothetical protein
MKQQITKKEKLKFTAGVSFFPLALIIITLSVGMAQDNGKGWERRPRQTYEISSSSFKIQGGDEFILDTQRIKLGLPDQDVRAKGINLNNYDLEFTFKNADGKHIQLWYKDSSWKNVYSWEYTIRGEEPIRYNPFADGRNVDEFDDFTRIYAIGAKVREGVKGIQIHKAKLIRRD